ncbi:MAG: Fe-Mn family superoxide dismutase [Bacillota bacterium]
MAGRDKEFLGITLSQIEHHIKQQYVPQIAKKQEIEARLIRADTVFANDTYCQLRSLKKELSYSVNSLRLHDYYFENLGNSPVKKPSVVEWLFSRDFGSFDEWKNEFIALGLCARGWVLTGYDLKEGRVRNFITDNHSEGVWSVVPLLVMDVYEHAYCPQYSSRQEYVREFLDNVNWILVGHRTAAAIEMHKAYEKVIKEK